MKKFIIALLTITTLLFAGASIIEARVKVKSYYKSNGIYVQPHYRNNPNSKKWDNYSSKGNYNPYTGKKGTVKWWNY